MLLAVLLVVAGRWLAPGAGWPANLALLGGGLLVPLIGLDLGLRGLGFADRVPQDTLLRRDPTYPDLPRYRPGGRFEGARPGTLSLIRGARNYPPYQQVFEVDARGFRNPPETARGPLDVVVFGDSFAEGGVVSQDQMWPALLRREGTRRVYCAAVSGTSPWAQLMTARVWAADLPVAPGAVGVWMLFGGNDLDEHYGPGTETPAPLGPLGAAQTQWKSFRRRSPLRRIWQGIQRHEASSREDLVPEAILPGGQRTLFFRPHADMVRRTPEAVRALPNYPLFQEVFAAMITVLRERGLRPLVVRAPSKEEVHWRFLPGAEPGAPPAGFSAVVADLCRGQGVEYLDLAPPLRARADRLWEDRNELLYFHDDTHWNAAGNAAVAEAVGERLRARPGAR